MPTGYRVTLGNAAIDPGDSVSNSATTTFTTSQLLGPGDVTWTNGSVSDTVSGQFYLGTDGFVYFVPSVAPNPGALGGTSSVFSFSGTQPNLVSYDDSDGADDGVITTGDGNDTIRGGTEADGVGGQNTDSTTPDDTISSGGGDDVIYGGIGDDSIDAGSGSDSIIIEDNFGADVIVGGEGGTDKDAIEVATSGAVTISYSGNEAGTLTDGADTLTFSQIEKFDLTGSSDSLNATADSVGIEVNAGGGSDTIIGGSGDDMIDGHDGSNSLSGGAGNDLMFDAGGADTIDGGSGDDTIYIGSGNDSVTGGLGSDRFEILSGFGADTIDGGTGDNDALTFRTVNTAVSVDVDGVKSGTVTSGTDSIDFSEIERFSLTDFADTYDATGTTQSQTVYGYAGNDTIIGGDGGDRLNAGSGNDSVTGSIGSDTIYGELGDDTISAGAGADTVFGAMGTDSIDGGTGADYVDGGGDDDTLIGGAGDDTIVGGLGADLMQGDGGNDQLYGQDGDDTLDGGDGNDALYGGAGDDRIIVGENSGFDTIVGGTDFETDGDTLSFSTRTTGVSVDYSDDSDGVVNAGTDTLRFTEIESIELTDQNDTLFGFNDAVGIDIDAGAGADSVTGGTGDDTLIGGAGGDTLQAGDGADYLSGGLGTNQLEGGAGADTLDGSGGGYDYATYINSTAAVNVDLSDNLTESGGEAQGDSLIGIEQVDGSNFNDTLTASDSGQELKGWGGDDSIVGAAGDDFLIGDLGADTISGGAGADFISGGDDHDQLNGGAGADIIGGGTGRDTIDGGTGNDSIRGGHGDDYIASSNTNSGDDTIHGDTGNDIIYTGSGDDWVSGGADNDTIYVAGGENTVFGGTGADRITTSGVGGASAIDGGSGADTISTYDGLGNNDTITGGAGNDSIVSFDGDDIIDGEADNDTIYAGAGNDTITGGAGDDRLEGGSGDDTFVLADGSGNDTITDFDIGDSDSDGFTNDQLDVSGIMGVDGVTPVTAAEVVVSDDGVGNALLTFPNGETIVLNGVSPAQISGQQALYSSGVPCFTPGTRVETPEGLKAVETLRAGDLVITKDNGPQPLTWTGARHLSTADLKAAPNTRPVEILAGALGNGRPIRVSPQHCFVLGAEHGFESDHFVRAKHLAETPLARVIETDVPLSYIHLLCAEHQVVVAEGTQTETFYPGPQALSMMSRTEVLSLAVSCPEAFKGDVAAHYGPRARRVLRRKDVLRVLGDRMPRSARVLAMAAK